MAYQRSWEFQIRSALALLRADGIAEIHLPGEARATAPPRYELSLSAPSTAVRWSTQVIFGAGHSINEASGDGTTSGGVIICTPRFPLHAWFRECSQWVEVGL